MGKRKGPKSAKVVELEALGVCTSKWVGAKMRINDDRCSRANGRVERSIFRVLWVGFMEGD